MDFENQNYIDLVKACFDEETLFEDPVFPPTNDSIDPTWVKLLLAETGNWFF